MNTYTKNSKPNISQQSPVIYKKNKISSGLVEY